MRRGALVLLFVSLSVSVFLFTKAWFDKPIPGCTEGEGCQIVLSSKWAYVSGVPVSLFGCVLYGLLMIFVFLNRSHSKLLFRFFETTLSLLVVFGAIWFYLVQAVFLQAFCPWCCLVHGVASLAALLLMISSRAVGVHSVFKAEVIAPLTMVVIFAFYQSSQPMPERVVETELQEGAGIVKEKGEVSLYEGQFRFNPRNYPMLGSPDSERVMVVLTDYTCPHCRVLHGTLRKFVEQKEADVSIVFLPAFRDASAQLLHRIMLTVWKDDPVYFEHLSERIISGEVSAEPNKVLTLVQVHSQGRFYEKAWAHASRIEQSFQLAQGILAANDARLEVSSLPQIMVGEGILQGQPSLETLSELLASPSPLTKASNPDAGQKHAGTGEAKIEFESKELELPTVPRGERSSKTFYFTNTGTSDLKITGVKVGCGCMVADGWKQTVSPGQRGSFKISLDTARQSGTVRKSILITSNASNVRGGALTLMVEGKVWLPVKLSNYTAHFGVIITGEQVKPKRIMMKVTDDGPFNLAEPVCNNNYFKTEWKEIKPGKEYVLTVSIPKLHRDHEQGEIVIPLGHSRYPELKIPVSARVADVVELSPSLLTFSAKNLSSPMTRLVTVYCHDRKFKDFDLMEYKLSGSSGAQLKVKPLRSPYWRQIEVAFPKGFDPVKAVSEKTAIHIQTNHPEGKELVLPLQLQPGSRRR